MPPEDFVEQQTDSHDSPTEAKKNSALHALGGGAEPGTSTKKRIVWVTLSRQVADALRAAGEDAVCVDELGADDVVDKHVIIAPDAASPGELIEWTAQVIAGLEVQSIRRVNKESLSWPTNDLEDLIVQKGADQLSHIVKHAELVAARSRWDAPILFDGSATPPVDPSLLPDPVGNYVAALADHTETPTALGTLLALAVLATAARGKFRVRINEAHDEPVNIYTMVALASGNRKSAIVKALTAPLVAWERDQARVQEAEIAKRRSLRKSQEALLDHRRRRLNVIKDAAERAEEMEAIAEEEARLPEIPAVPQLFANDMTAEALATALADQGGVFSLLSDEGGIADVLAGLYSQGHANIDVFLKGWDGGDVRIRRRDREISLKPLLTVGLAVQPSVLANIAGKRAFKGRGVVERFLYAIPTSRLGHRTHDRPAPSAELVERYSDTVLRILERSGATFDLDREASAVFRDFQRHLERKLGPGGELAELQGWASKLPGQLARVAALIQLAQDQHCSNTVITKTSMARALELGEVLMKHAVAAFLEMRVDQETEDARKCWRWIEGQRRLCFDKAELTVAMRHSMKVDRIDAALRMLANRQLIDEGIGDGTRRKKYRVNPSALPLD